MLDVFMIAITVLCCLLGPGDAKTVRIDVFEASSGRVQTLDAERTDTGFLLGAPGEKPIQIKRAEGGTFNVLLPEGEAPLSIDLSAALKALEGKQAIKEFKVEDQVVRVSRSRGLNYLSIPASPERLFVIRGATAKPK